MEEDLLADFRPIRKWRQKMLEDTDVLGSAIELWHRTAKDFFRKATSGEYPEAPQGISDLTYLLATICDIGPAKIDPSPLTECLAVMMDFVGYPGTGTELHRAISVLNRMTFAWVALEGKEPPPPISFLTPANEDRDKWAHNQKKSGMAACEILAGIRKRTEWAQLETEQAVGKAIDRFCERNSLPLLRR